MSKQLTRAEQREWQLWLDLCKRIQDRTAPIQDESEDAKAKRIAGLLTSFEAFCAYYFPHYLSSEFGWFHKAAAKAITADPDIFAILEWPREHAKSVFADVLMPLWLKAKGELTGMMIGSANQDKAKGLLGDVQAELTSNQRYLADFGSQMSIGNWQDGHFVTADGVGFWAFGRGQSPRGTREAEKRPNYGVIDDIDDKAICKNITRVREAVDWVLEDFFGALSIKGARLVVAGNRIHQHSILAHLVGDTDPETPMREGIYHLKVFAIEGRAHKEASPENGKPAWPERYILEQLIAKMSKMGYRSAQREFFHRHIAEGFIFRPEWIEWIDCPDYDKYENLVAYLDPSWKATTKNDFKALVLCGKRGAKVDVLHAWVRQASVASMVNACYDLYDLVGDHARYYIEANMLQELLMDDFDDEGERRGYYLPIRADRTKKDNKEIRIENLSPLFERGHIRFNAAHRKQPDMQTLVQQFLGFGSEAHDDGPDATEGCVYHLQRGGRTSKVAPRTGQMRQNPNRRA